MASTTLIITVLMAAMVTAGFSSNSDSKFPNFSKMFQFVSPLPLPQLPGFPPLNAPSLLWPTNFPNFAPIPPMPSFPPLTVQDVANQGALPGSQYTGAAISSQSTAVRGPDGKIQRKGGSTILVNDNGHVTLTQTGQAPPVIVTQYTNRPFLDFPEPEDFMGSKFKMPKMKQFSFKMPTMKPFDFDFPKMPPMDPDTIKNYVPGKNENYKGTFHSSSSHFSDDNGVKKSGAKVTSLQNDNGKVEEEKIAFEKGPK